MSTLHFFPAGSPWCLLCTDSLWGKCAQGLIKVLPGSFLGSILLPPGEPVCCLWRWPYEACWSVVLPFLFTIEVLTAVAMLLLARVLYPYSRVSEASPLQSYGFFMLWLKWRSAVIPRQKCLRLYFSHLQSSNFSRVILLYFHLIVWLLRWCVWTVLLALFFTETLSSVSKIYHLYSLFFVSSNLCDFVYLFRWSFMILFFYICIILCAYFKVYLAGPQIMRVKVIS